MMEQLSKAKDWKRKVFFYCSRDKKSFNRIPKKDQEFMRKYLGKVACMAVCNKIIISIPSYEELLKGSCLSQKEILDYADGKILYGWHLNYIYIFDKPKKLSEFKTLCKEYEKDEPNCEECKYFIDGRGYEYDESDCGCNGLKPLTRPPQTWCYVVV